MIIRPHGFAGNEISVLNGAESCAGTGQASAVLYSDRSKAQENIYCSLAKKNALLPGPNQTALLY